MRTGHITPSFIARLDARDRALFLRWAIDESHTPGWRRWCTAITHLGGATATILAVCLPLLLGGAARELALDAMLTLAGSHLLVQLVKRTVGRPRPSLGSAAAAWVAEPDRFSFPSGHAAAAMSVAMVYAAAAPALAPALLALALAVGMTRVFLGVHYPGDVLAGQLLAAVTAWLVLAT